MPPLTLPDPVLDDLRAAGEDPVRAELPAPDADAARQLQPPPAGRPLLVRLPGRPPDERLAAVRNALWPALHLLAIYRVRPDGRATRRTGEGKTVLAEGRPGATDGTSCTLLLLRRREDATGRQTTRAKFDANAAGWNGDPGSPSYGHYRWMRRLLALVARPRRGERALDAGSGTGWVGIEAALLGAQVSAFDPSPAMIELARANAASVGVPLDARVGFVEAAPFEQPFDLVLNSGVISFAPDAAAFIEGIDRLVARGGRLVIGDLNPASRGFRRRRERLPLLPVRELGGLRRRQVEQLLVARGYRIAARRYYQLSWPVPQLMALSERRAGGFGCGLLLALNRLASALDALIGARCERGFDSWILVARKPS